MSNPIALFGQPYKIWQSDQSGWVTYDVSSYVPSDANAVIVYLYQVDYDNSSTGFRPYGSSVENYLPLGGYSGFQYAQAVIPIASRKFQVYQTGPDSGLYGPCIYLAGYFQDSRLHFLDTPYYQSWPEGDPSLQEIDLSSYIPSNAIGVIFNLCSEGWEYKHFTVYTSSYTLGSNGNISGYFTGTKLIPIGSDRKIYVSRDHYKPPGKIEVIGYITDNFNWVDKTQIYYGCGGPTDDFFDVATDYEEGTPLMLLIWSDAYSLAESYWATFAARPKGSTWDPKNSSNVAWDGRTTSLDTVFVQAGQDGYIQLRADRTNYPGYSYVYVLAAWSPAKEAYLNPAVINFNAPVLAAPREMKIITTQPAYLLFSAPRLLGPQDAITGPAYLAFKVPELVCPIQSGIDPPPGLYRVYYSYGVWNLDPRPLKHANLKIAFNTDDVADTLSAEIYENGENLQKGDRLWYQDPDGRHWGGLLLDFTEKRNGVYEITGIGYTWLLKDIILDEDFYQTGDWLILKKILNKFLPPLQPQLVYTGEYIINVPRFFAEGKDALTVIKSLAISKDKHFYFTQEHWYTSPKFYWVDLDDEVVQTFESDDVYGDWRREESIESVVNKVIVEGQLPDQTSMWDSSDLATDTLRHSGEIIRGFGGLSLGVGFSNWLNSSTKNLGIKGVLSEETAISDIYVMFYRVGNPSTVNLEIKDSEGNTHGAYVLNPGSEIGAGSFGVYHYSFTTPVSLPAGETYVNLSCPLANSSNYWGIGSADADIGSMGLKASLSNDSSSIWDSGSVDTGYPLMILVRGPGEPDQLDSSGQVVFGWDESSVITYQHPEGGIVFSPVILSGPPLLAYYFQFGLTDPEKHSGITLSIKGRCGFKFVLAGATGGAEKTFWVSGDYTLSLETSDWDWVSTNFDFKGTVLYIYPLYGVIWLKSLEITGLSYDLSYVDQNSINYHRFEAVETLDVSSLDNITDIEEYAQNYLNSHAFPSPSYSINIPGKGDPTHRLRNYTFTLSNGQTFTRRVVGMEISIPQQVTTLILDAFSVKNLGTVLAKIAEKK